MTQGIGAVGRCSDFIQRHFFWFLIGSYAVAALAPGPGLWVGSLSFGHLTLFSGERAVTLPMLMLALLLVNAGLGVRTSELKNPARGIGALLAGFAANRAVPLAYVLGTAQALRLWHDPAEAQDIVLGLALVAAMPIAGSSTAWSQIVNGDLALSLWLVLLTTLLSPVTTPPVLHAVGFLAGGDCAADLHALAAGGTGAFLILCVVLPSALGILGRWKVGGARIDAAKHPLKLFNAANLLLLNYANASLSLPQALSRPDPDFLAVTLAVVVGLCLVAFGSGWLIARLLRVDRARQAALMFGLGMSNNGTGLVLASVALAGQPRVLLPLLLYNLTQHLVAGAVAHLLGGASGGAGPARRPSPPGPPAATAAVRDEARIEAGRSSVARFFIDRPVFASVLSILITLLGAVSLPRLPLALYPPVTPPTVQVDCKYPGASAQVLAEAVAAPIEQQVNGVEGMMYMSSQCTNDGTYNLRVTFQIGTNPDLAWVNVQNRVNLALPVLPDVVRQAGVPTRKRTPDMLMAIALTSPDDRYDQLHLSNYLLIHLRDELARVPGVSDVRMQNRDYAMRVWLDPQLLAARQLSVGDVVAALREQNAPIACGQLGQPPGESSQPFQFPVTTIGRLSEAAEFENVIVRQVPGQAPLRLKDVGRVELGARSQDVSMRVDCRQAISLTLYALPNANALQTADAVKARVAELARTFPEDLQYEIRYDTTPFVRDSIRGVVTTLEESVVLVAAVVLVFLQSWRSAVIPLVAVPVALVGTFAVMAALRFSLNTLTLFGLVLSVGIVVDDAIVVVEAVGHHIERGLSPRRAAHQAMAEVSGPVIAVALVLSAVFVPCAFVGGITGQFFRQFALTIAASALISACNSLTLSPALAALLLRPSAAPGDGAAPRSVFLRAAHRLGRSFNTLFTGTTGVYTRAAGLLLRRGGTVLVVYGGLLCLTYWTFTTTPRGFVPAQDMGYILVEAQLPDATALERTERVMDRVERICQSVEGVRHTQLMTVFGGMIGVTAFGLLLTPVFFDRIEGLSAQRPAAGPLVRHLERSNGRAVQQDSHPERLSPVGIGARDAAKTDNPQED
jgi:predicted Na+-dependent transporter